MKVHLYTARDRQINAFNYPQTSPLDKEQYFESIRRGVIKETIKPEVAANVEIFYVGDFDDETCTFDLLPEPEFIGDFSKEVGAINGRHEKGKES